jgi:hypothetical protein
MPREELKSRLKLPPRVFNAVVHELAGAASGSGSPSDGDSPRLVNTGAWIALTSQSRCAPGEIRRCAVCHSVCQGMPGRCRRGSLRGARGAWRIVPGFGRGRFSQKGL